MFTILAEDVLAPGIGEEENSMAVVYLKAVVDKDVELFLELSF